MLSGWITEMHLWLLGTAVIFTFVGRHLTMRDQMEDVVEATIDSLIENGYIKTRGEGENLELLKHWEHND